MNPRLDNLISWVAASVAVTAAGDAILNHFGKPRNTTALCRLVRND
jgi:hypothetical protein